MVNVYYREEKLGQPLGDDHPNGSMLGCLDSDSSFRMMSQKHQSQMEMRRRIVCPASKLYSGNQPPSYVNSKKFTIKSYGKR